MKFLMMFMLYFFVITSVQAKNLDKDNEPQLQRGESINEFLNKNPNVQKTWITSQDRKKAALARYASNCNTKKKDCGKLANSDGLAKTSNNTVVRKIK
jgi:hypothetical protein